MCVGGGQGMAMIVEQFGAETAMSRRLVQDS